MKDPEGLKQHFLKRYGGDDEATHEVSASIVGNEYFGHMNEKVEENFSSIVNVIRILVVVSVRCGDYDPISQSLMVQKVVE